MLDWIIEPMQYEFMQRALIVSALAAMACGVVGTFVVLRGMAFLGDAIAHSALTGMAAAFLLGGECVCGGAHLGGAGVAGHIGRIPAGRDPH